jgi:hypothetical protein
MREGPFGLVSAFVALEYFSTEEVGSALNAMY